MRVPDAPRTVRARLAAPVVALLFRRIAGRLAAQGTPIRIELPDGTVIGDAAEPSPDLPPAPRMILHDPAAFARRVGADGLIGFGEAYMAGDWASPDLDAVLARLATRMTDLVPGRLQGLRRLYVRARPQHERNTTENARRNIAEHYDLSNDFFALFLDPTMTYSSGLFDDAQAAGWGDLAAAQRAKIDRLLDAAGVGEGTRLLEIGTGWGELCIRAAARGAHVRSVTLSEEQQAEAARRVRAAGYGDRVRVDLCDYRAVDGQYDAVVSVEMIEAVGHEYWAGYFRSVDALLAPGGRFALQAITMPHDRMLRTRDTYTWIQKYIFPGGFLPSAQAIESVARRCTDLRVRGTMSFGPHYARTLRLWDQRSQAQSRRIAALGFDRVFRRMWHFYLCYAEAGFRSGYLDVQQIVLDRPVERTPAPLQVGTDREGR
ncbi:class I SAM-dependent methyltransferase [Tomitella cavernea]|uniref:class I SAM-dependent methyltransferase n=1 Tax=Tomitella cavernea TaxID=1387982 RepID=UPI003556D80A